MSRNLATVTSILPYTIGAAIPTSLSQILSAPAYPKVYKIESIIVSNVDGTNDADVNVALNLDSTVRFIAKTVTVPADSTLIVTTADTPIYLSSLTLDSLYASASAASDLEILISYQEITTSA